MKAPSILSLSEETVILVRVVNRPKAIWCLMQQKIVYLGAHIQEESKWYNSLHRILYMSSILKIVLLGSLKKNSLQCTAYPGAAQSDLRVAGRGTDMITEMTHWPPWQWFLETVLSRSLIYLFRQLQCLLLSSWGPEIPNPQKYCQSRNKFSSTKVIPEANLNPNRIFTPN